MAGRGDGQPVVLRELEGEQRFVVLRDSELPEQGTTIGGKVRMVKTFYPGSSTPSYQLLGTEEDDLLLQGWFRDVWTGQDGNALEQRAKLEAIRHGQRWCELSWGEVFSVRGFVKEVRFPIDRESDIRYELVFDVAESDAAEIIAAKPFPEKTEADLVALSDEVEAFLDEAREVAGILTVVQAVI